MNAIEFENITKKFENFIANDDITFYIRKNDVHCILGENGAGKSTLMNILFGIYKKDSGKLKVFGNEVEFSSPLDAIKNNIGMVHQHFMLIDDFTVLENVILGNEISNKYGLDFKTAEDILNKLIAKYDLGIDLSSTVSSLSIGLQQKVEILKLLYRESEILIFDEPTAVLSPVEVDLFFKIIESFKADGKTIIFITHKLNEVKYISDRVSVLRKGKLVYEADNNKNSALAISELSNAIVGDVSNIIVTENRKINKNDSPAFELNNIFLSVNNVRKLNDLCLNLFMGEIHGICGVEGNGQSELVDIVYGLQKNFTGQYVKNVSGGISIVPDDRKRKGFIKEFNIGENISLKGANFIYLPADTINKISDKIISGNDIRLSDKTAPMGNLSGGNQQKVIFARETISDNNILILVHPTRGVDINATAFIHNEILLQRNEGKAVLLISSDLDELISLSDRLSVMYKGEITRTFNRDEYSGYIRSESEVEPETDPEFLQMLGKLMTGIND
ncbi:MAG TPA: ABC transporter ATP-binding protein [Bacteroidetes bacterium]|nr:ABC transporter ATP-binding protein [Bacteroidota bacterium]HRJ97996.1 ABC transporter ATP-binding protein [Ignavibacteria bacterium]